MRSSFPLDVRGVARAEGETRAAELIELVQLTAQAGRYPHQVSGGQAQRCAVRKLHRVRTVIHDIHGLVLLATHERQKCESEIHTPHNLPPVIP